MRTLLTIQRVVYTKPPAGRTSPPSLRACVKKVRVGDSGSCPPSNLCDTLFAALGKNPHLRLRGVTMEPPMRAIHGSSAGGEQKVLAKPARASLGGESVLRARSD